MCFTREKEHYELPSDFSVKYEDLLQVPQEPTTCLNKEDVKLLNDWRNEFGRGVRQQSVRNSFTKDKAGTLPFYMYTSVNLHTEVDETSHDLAEATVEELFKSVSSTRSTRETDTPTQTTHNQLSAAGNTDISVLDAVPEPTEPEDGNESGHDVRLPHTGIYAIRGRSNIFSLFISSEMKHNDIFGTEYAVVDESSFIFARAGEGALTSCKKSDIFCEMDKGAVRLCDGRLELAEETFCKILSDCRGERDMESDEIGENHDISPDSEEEGDLTGLTTIWSRRRPVHPPRYMEDFFEISRTINAHI